MGDLGLKRKLDIIPFEENSFYKRVVREKGDDFAQRYVSQILLYHLGDCFNDADGHICHSSKNQREKWNDYVNGFFTPIDDLVLTARDLFELIQERSGGVFRFENSYGLRFQGPFTVVSDGLKGEGFPIGWHVKGDSLLNRYLHLSSDVESEVSRRVNRKYLQDGFINGSPLAPLERIGVSLEVSGRWFSAEDLTDIFKRNHRNFSCSYNYMPLSIESAFNHLLGEEIRVEGFNYPHPKLDYVLY